eukprot:COSAG06_NODE_47131_length_341_cov_1.057851_1_plen_23_part_10
MVTPTVFFDPFMGAVGGCWVAVG